MINLLKQTVVEVVTSTYKLKVLAFSSIQADRIKKDAKIYLGKNPDISIQELNKKLFILK